jgi:uncharacterized iron-regulated membrane protein
MGTDGQPWDTVGGLLLTPVLVVAFVCGAIGSFVIWRLRTAAEGRHVGFDLHLFHGQSRHVGKAAAAFALGLIALLLPLSLILQLAG